MKINYSIQKGKINKAGLTPLSIKFKDLHDNGFTGIEFLEEEPVIDSEEDVTRETENIDQEILINNRIYEDPIYEADNRINYEVISEETESTSNTTKQKEGGFGKTILIFIISFIFIGAILSRLSFLGFNLYPIWLGGTFLLTNFIYNIFTSEDSKK